VRANIAALYTQVTLMDRRAGQILGELEADGLSESTIVFYYSDHGTGLPRSKRWLYDSGIRVPLIIRFPVKFRHLAPAKAGSVVDRLVSFVDFPPTMLSLTGLEIPEYAGPRFPGLPQANRDNTCLPGDPVTRSSAAAQRATAVITTSATICRTGHECSSATIPRSGWCAGNSAGWMPRASSRGCAVVDGTGETTRGTLRHPPIWA
jgi:arylsulfatase A-like enzyme